MLRSVRRVLSLALLRRRAASAHETDTAFLVGTGGTICAERTALVKAVSEGKRKFAAIAVSSCVRFATLARAYLPG